MTIDEFFAHVQDNGFNGYAPSATDVLCDRWAKKIGEVFDEVAADLPHGQFRHAVWLTWQWLYCMIAGAESRVIASPPACRAAGLDIGPEVVSKACELLLKSEAL